MKGLPIIITLLFSHTLQAQLQPWYKDWKNNDYIVTASVLNVRASDSRTARVVDQISEGTLVTSLEQTIPPNKEQQLKAYHKVCYSSSGTVQEGYVAASYLSQFYQYDRQELIYLKVEKPKETRNRFSINSLKNDVNTILGYIDTYSYRWFSLELIYPNGLKDVRRIIEIQNEDNDSCSSTYTQHTIVEMMGGQMATLPPFAYQIDEVPGPTLDLHLPGDPYGESNKIVLIEMDFTTTGHFGTKINKIDKIASYRWNGSEFIEIKLDQ